MEISKKVTTGMIDSHIAELMHMTCGSGTGSIVGCLRYIGHYLQRNSHRVRFKARAVGYQIPLRGRYMPAVTIGLLDVYLMCDKKWNEIIPTLTLFVETAYAATTILLAKNLFAKFKCCQFSAIMSRKSCCRIGNRLISFIKWLRCSRCGTGAVYWPFAFNTPWLTQSQCTDAKLSYEYDVYLCVNPAQRDTVLIPIKTAIGSKRKIPTDDDFDYGRSVINNLMKASQCCRWLVLVVSRRVDDFPILLHVINDVLAKRACSLVPIVCKDFDDYETLNLLRPYQPLQWPENEDWSAFWDNLLERTDQPNLEKLNEDKGIT